MRKLKIASKSKATLRKALNLVNGYPCGSFLEVFGEWHWRHSRQHLTQIKGEFEKDSQASSVKVSIYSWFHRLSIFRIDFARFIKGSKQLITHILTRFILKRLLDFSNVTFYSLEILFLSLCLIEICQK